MNMQGDEWESAGNKNQAAEYIDLAQVEETARQTIERRYQGKTIKNIHMGNSELIELQGLPVIQLAGEVDVVAREGRTFSREQLQTIHFRLSVHAETGKVLALKVEDKV